MDKIGFSNRLLNHLADDKISASQAALKTLYDFTKDDNSKTIQGFISNLKEAKKLLGEVNPWLLSLRAAGEQYVIFITLTYLEDKDFEMTRQNLVNRGKLFVENDDKSRQLIAKHAEQLIADNQLGCYIDNTQSIYKLLTFSKSLSVYQALLQARDQGKKFHVYVARGAAENGGEKMVGLLREEKISCTLIEDANVGYYMEYVDAVLVGAEGVTMNGGVFATAGTSMVAQYAARTEVPFYVLASCTKFIRETASSQKDIGRIVFNDTKPRLEPIKQPPLDFTHPSLITQFVTDVGLFSIGNIDELYTQLYY